MSSFSGADLGAPIASHTLLLQPQDYIIPYQKVGELEEPHISQELQQDLMLSLEETCCWPLSEKYINLARGLRAMQTRSERDDPFKQSRKGLRKSQRIRQRG
jgi:hypothetical protein